MERLECQICADNFTSVVKLKRHLHSAEHRKKFTQVFPNEPFRRNGRSYTPWIFVTKPDACPDPLLGLSQLTLCFCSEVHESFYLCHVCEAKFDVSAVKEHVSNKEHFLHYFSYNDPNLLSFCSESTGSFIPDSLMENIKKEKESVGSGRLQVLHLPDLLFWECSKGNYRHAMFLLHENESLSYVFNELKPQRIQIPTYRDDMNRKHPLVGLNYIVECLLCFSPKTQQRVYLCTLCRLHLSFSKIIRHLLTFEHVYTYLSLWHPNTLKARGYYKHNDPDHVSAALADFAMQAEKLQGRTMIKRIKLEAKQMLYVLNSSYEDALRNIAHLDGTNQRLVPAVRPRKRLKLTLPETSNKPPDVKQEDALLMAKNCLNEGLKPKLDAVASKTEHQFDNVAEMTETPASKQSAAQEKAPLMVSQCSPSAATAPAPPSAALLNTDKSFEQAVDGSDRISEETSHDLTKAALTGREPVCTFITSGPVVPMTDSEIVNTRDRVDDQFQDTTSASSRIADTPKTTNKPVCKFLSLKSATKNMSSPAMSNVKATPTPAQDCTTVTTVSNAAKAAPNQQDQEGSVQSKRRAESDTGGEKASKVGILSDNYSSAKRTIAESFSSHTKLSSTLERTNIQSKTPQKRQQLNVKAASQFKHKNSESGNEMHTPTTPSSDPLLNMPVIETSQKAPSKMPHIGVDQLLKVVCGNHHLSFCLACSTRLEATSHMNTAAHQMNCVKLKFPLWSSKPSEEELSKMVAHLLDNEAALKQRPKRVEVSADVYKEIKSLSDNKAIQRASDLFKRQSLKKSFQQQPLALRQDTAGKENNATIKSNVQPVKPFPGSGIVAPHQSSPVNKPTSVVAPMVFKGKTTDETSNLSRIVKVKGIVVIGLRLVWECRGPPPKHPTFYLCESCSQTIPVSEICNHMTSRLHNYQYLRKQYPKFMYWEEEELPQHIKLDLIDLIPGLVKEREESMDAQTVLLCEQWYERVRAAPFVDALKVVHGIKREKTKTLLPFITMPPEQDHTNHMASSTMDTEHECDAVCASDTDSMHSTLNDFLNLESPCVVSFNSSQKPNKPAHLVKDLKLTMSSKNEDKDVFVPDILDDSRGNSSLSHGLAVTPSAVDTIEAADIKLKADIQLCLPSKQTPLSPNPIENNVAQCAEDKQMTEECLSRGLKDASSFIDHNSNKNPSLYPVAEDASDNHYYQMLISLLKQRKKECN